MSIITYPLNGVVYSAEDVATYLCTRTSGVYSKETNFAVSNTGTRQITVAPGLAWINYDDFKGVSVCSREENVLTVPEADNTLNRVDRVVLQFDTSENIAAIKLKTGTPAVAAQPPDILQNHNQYELGLCTISVPAGSTAVTAADITDTRADETVCGVMRDGVTGIPTAQLQTQAKAMLDSLQAEVDSGSFYTKEAVDAMLAVIQAQVAKAGAPTERLAFVTQISAGAWGHNNTMHCEATIPEGVDFIRITPRNFNSPYVLQFSSDKDLSLTSSNSKAIYNICGGGTYETNFTYTAANRKIKITRFNSSIGSTCIQGYKYGTAATPCIVWTEGDGTSAKDHDIDYIEIKEQWNSGDSSNTNTKEAVARVVKGSNYTTEGGATVTFASDGTVTASNYYGTLVGYRYMTLTEVSEQLASTQSALADADALNLDQDYRLTLLELGVTDDETTA